MTDKAATLATFSDFRLVKGRKVAQLIFEVPIEQADAALKALGGVPMAASEVWCGIARVQAVPALASPKLEKERRRWDELSYAEQAGIRCSEGSFASFLGAFKFLNSGESCSDAVRRYCDVKTRADIKPNTYAGQCWENLNREYQIWLREAEVV